MAALKRGAKQHPIGGSAGAPGPSAPKAAAEAAPEKGAAAQTKPAEEGQQARRKKCIMWSLLALLLLALLFGIAVAIAVPVSRQNAARAAAHSTAKGPRGPPLTFKIDVAVPPDDDPQAGPVCGTLFGKAQDSSKRVEVRQHGSGAGGNNCTVAQHRRAACRGLTRLGAPHTLLTHLRTVLLATRRLRSSSNSTLAPLRHCTLTQRAVCVAQYSVC